MEFNERQSMDQDLQERDTVDIKIITLKIA